MLQAKTLEERLLVVDGFNLPEAKTVSPLYSASDWEKVQESIPFASCKQVLSLLTTETSCRGS